MISNGRQPDFTKRAIISRARKWCTLAIYAVRSKSRTFSSLPIAMILSRAGKSAQEVQNGMKEFAGIVEQNFNYAFSEMSSAQCLILFRFEKQHVLDLVPILSWPENKNRTTRNVHSVSPILATCVIPCRMKNTSPKRTEQALFGKHRSQLSKIFWEA